MFDDAHADKQFVGEEYRIRILRNEDLGAYLYVPEALKPFMSGPSRQRLQGEPDRAHITRCGLTLPAVDSAALATLDATLAQLQEPHQLGAGFPVASICRTTASKIRPVVPPTFETRYSFAQACALLESV
ncbi:hypothetical protein [Nocardioides pocheonensis]|uniref:Uncharacterized protein n=1 Tax=Nocardioides pocheonensis TaxID=661485 RepID=A0A3N0GJ56_9ACTN|nr:hypothetical protein [Nocardioides pocheonensis]RNM12148.1 hypothetical protein EFL26_20290 [Nocardioides pocheonensis]